MQIKRVIETVFEERKTLNVVLLWFILVLWATEMEQKESKDDLSVSS